MITKIVSVLGLVFFLLMYSSLDSQVVLHFDINGNPDSYGSKNWYLLFTLIPIVLAFVGDYYLKRQTSNDVSVVSAFIFDLVLFFVVLNIIILDSAKDMSFNLNSVVVLLALLFFNIARKLDKLKRNKYIGIRFKATLSNDTIWNEVHKRAKLILMIHSLITLGLALITFKVLLDGYLLMYFVLVLLVITGYLYMYAESQKRTL